MVGPPTVRTLRGEGSLLHFRFLTILDKRGFFLTISPLENEETEGAGKHLSFFDYILQLYGKTLNNVVSIIGDNCNVSKAVSMRS